MHSFPFREFHLAVHAGPRTPASSTEVVWQGWPIRALAVGSLTAALPVSFEEAYAQLEELGGVFIEPDGSFVRGASAELQHRWRYEGVLYDQGERLHYVELKGEAPLDAVQPIFEILRAGSSELVFQFVQAAVFVDAAELARWWEKES